MRQLERFDCKSLKSHPFILKNHVNNPPTPIASRRTTSLHHDEGKKTHVHLQAQHLSTLRFVLEEEDNDNSLDAFTDYSVQSRLNTEFEVIGVVGKGAFGEVLKVRNKLDSRVYAIKRIRINPHNKLYNKQITREVKLLSRLNHENVVR